MRIAVFLVDINLEYLSPDVTRVFFFDVDENLIISVGEEVLMLHDIHYLCLRMLGKKVEVIYIEQISESMKNQVEKIGIIVKPLKEIRNNPFLKALLLSDD